MRWRSLKSCVGDAPWSALGTPDTGASHRQMVGAQWPQSGCIVRQEHPPDRMGLSDFADMGELGFTIASEPFGHRLYHFRLPLRGSSTPMSCWVARASWPQQAAASSARLEWTRQMTPERRELIGPNTNRPRA